MTNKQSNQPPPLKLPQVLLIGATHRNQGKTEFACRVIRRQAQLTPVVGLKITVIRETEGGACPRGGAGCGVCSALKGSFLITREQIRGGKKDTQRMLTAGATDVYWLRVREHCLDAGLRELFSQIPAGIPVVAESNSARKRLEPSIFITVGDASSPNTKKSFRNIQSFVDIQAVPCFEEDTWTFEPEQLSWDGSRWVASWPNIAAVILAGGQSRRMGRDKSLIPFLGMPLIQRIRDQLRPHFHTIHLSTNTPEKYRFLDLPHIPDREPGQGPLMGIVSALTALPHSKIFITGCDIPIIDSSFLYRLLSAAQHADIVTGRSPNGRSEPLLAVYDRSILPLAEELLASGVRRISCLFDNVNHINIPIPAGANWYHNLNTPEDLEAAEKILAQTMKGCQTP